MSTTHHPLLIPEILAMIASFVGHWHPSQLHYASIPKDLLSCSQVCTTWRRATLPILWYQYDDNDPILKKAPKYIIYRYAHHARVLRLSVYLPSRISNVFDRVHRLTELSLQRPFLVLGQGLIDRNTRLSRLNIKGEDQSLVSDKELEGLLRLTRLKELTMFQCRFGDGLIELFKNMKVLTRLNLNRVTAVVGTLEDSLWPHMAITDLTLGQCHFPKDLLQGLLSKCPLLTRLCFSEDQGSDLPFLGNVLQASCPRLTVLSLAFSEHTDSNDQELATLLDTIPKTLESLILRLAYLQDLTATAITQHASTLVCLDLTLFESATTRLNSSQQVALLLGACSNLESLTLYKMRGFSLELGNILLEAPWSCLSLKSLTLDGYGTPSDIFSFTTSSVTVRAAAVAAAAAEALRKNGARLPKEWKMRHYPHGYYGMVHTFDEESAKLRVPPTFDMQLIRLLGPMVQLAQVTINDIRYERTVGC